MNFDINFDMNFPLIKTCVVFPLHQTTIIGLFGDRVNVYWNRIITWKLERNSFNEVDKFGNGVRNE